MQLVSASIWTRIAVSISYDDNHYTTGTFLFLKAYDQGYNQRAIRILNIIEIFLVEI